jgi:hypothetical protein
MRFARRAPLLLIALSALLAGCGGNQIAAEEVPGDPPVLTVPTDPDAAPGAAASNAGDSSSTDQSGGAESTPTPDPGSGSSSSGTTGGTTGGTTSGGTTAAPTATATATPSQDTGGAQADEGLDQFCADNPGAC